jgi:beta-glucanase (GH16 family)
VWHDEFGGDQGLGQARADVDSSEWSFQELNVNNELQVYTTKQCLAYSDDWNYCVEDGRLRIQGRNETVVCGSNGDGGSSNPVCAPSYGNGFHASANYTSGRLMSKHKVHFHDGYLEFRVKLPDAARAGLPESGMWPAVWMLGENINQGPTPGGVDWPGCGEVDVMEYSTSGGASKQGWNAIWAGPGGTNACSSWPQGGNAACGPCDQTGGQCVGEVTNGARYEFTGWPNFDHHSWHTYGFKWENTGNNATDLMTWYIDGVKMGVLHLGAEQAAFKSDMFLTINLALGGTLGGPIQITDWADAYLDVDYFRWYRLGQADTCGFGAAPDAGADAASDTGGASGASGGAGADAAAGTSGASGASAGAGADAAAGSGGASGAGGAPPVCAGQPDGTPCDDGNACNGHETCQGGACTAGAAVTCAPADACHAAGACNPATGLCSSPAAANGTACDDGNACNGHETCQGGACTAGAAVTCAAADACHVAGTCNPATGLCSNPTAANGTACDDGNVCNGHETCQAGVCTAGTPSCSNGTGLAGEYFDNADLTNLKVTRVDATVNFNWGTGSPDPSIGPDTFSVRWSGTVTPLFSETYTFFTKTDDGARLWVNGQQLVNRWVDQGATEVSGSIALVAGTAYAIKMEYYDDGGGASAQLSWSSAHTPKQIIPQAQLVPASVAPPPPPPPITFPVKINFQPAGTVPTGYVSDLGDVYGSRTAGLTYGWSVSHTGNARKRGVNADLRLDTLNQFHAGAKWELAVPNGTYNVLVNVGDPSFASSFTINVEGVSYWKAASLTANHFLQATKAVTVTDGRLTIDQGAAAEMATRIDYVEISK